MYCEDMWDGNLWSVATFSCIAVKLLVVGHHTASQTVAKQKLNKANKYCRCQCSIVKDGWESLEILLVMCKDHKNVEWFNTHAKI